MRSSQVRSPVRRAWRSFLARDGRQIVAQLLAGEIPLCPCCQGSLVACGTSRRTPELPLDAIAYDLDCPGCRRYWSIVQHSERSLRLVRMRRFVAALREDASPAPSRAVERSLLA